MTQKEELMQLQEALRLYAAVNGLAAADALVIDCATDADLAKVGEALRELKTIEGRPVKIGPGIAAEIVRAVGTVLIHNHYEHTEPWPGAVDVYGGVDADR